MSETGAGLSKFQAEIYKLQLELFHANQRLINDAVEGYTDEFRRYEARYRRSLKTSRGPVAYRQLLRDSKRAKVILCGDYHTFEGAQVAFIRLLKQQPLSGGKVIVALEMLLGRHQDLIDRFVRGEMSERSFLRKTEHDRHWPFGPFEVVRPLFELARKRGWRVVGIDQHDPGGRSLAERDRFAAERIVEALREEPNARAFALVGEMHLAPGHLPREVSLRMRRAKVEGSVLRVHQSPDLIWFDAASRGPTGEVVDISHGAYALLTASPVVCQQSFLTWMDQAEDGTPAARIYWADNGRRAVRMSAYAIGRALGLPVRDAIKKVTVVGPGDLSFFERLRESGLFSAREMRQIRAQILASESYYIPKARMIYLATLSLSHAAEEASHMLRHRFSGEGIDDPKGLVDAFYSRVMNEAVGFLGSKIVNPNRQAVHMKELAVIAAGKSLGGLDTPDAFEIASAILALDHKRMELGKRVPRLSRVFHASPELFIAVTHILGYILGDNLYSALVSGKLSRREARTLFREPFEEEGAALLLYFEWIFRVGRRRR
jgi:uncharacterized iron-regulated protein